MARRWLQRNIIFTMWPHWTWIVMVVLVQKDYWLGLFPGNFSRCPILRAGPNWSTCKSLCSNKEGWRGDCSWIHITTSTVFPSVAWSFSLLMCQGLDPIWPTFPSLGISWMGNPPTHKPRSQKQRFGSWFHLHWWHCQNWMCCISWCGGQKHK